MACWIALVMLMAAWLSPMAGAQEKVAEGEYQMRRPNENRTTTMDHWILYTRKQGGYRLESEVTSASGTGVIVIQTEELSEQLEPAAINIRLYTHENTKKPFSSLSCHLSTEQIECQAAGEPLSLSSSTEQKGPVLFVINKLENTDMMWMLSAAIHRAHLNNESTRQVPTLVLQNGEDGPELALSEIDTLHSEVQDTVELHGIKIPSHRYRFETKKIKCWIADSGLLLKMENEDGAVIHLEKLKQYKTLVPELP